MQHIQYIHNVYNIYNAYNMYNIFILDHSDPQKPSHHLTNGKNHRKLMMVARPNTKKDQRAKWKTDWSEYRRVPESG